jgi:predicted transposase YdaD
MNVLGKDRAMQSWLWQMGADEGRAEGRAQGRAEGQLKGRVLAARQICADLVKELHPRVAGRVLRVIGACEDPETLRAWVLQCPKLSDAEFVALVTGKPAARPSRSRASRPSRRARPSKRR